MKNETIYSYKMLFAPKRVHRPKRWSAKEFGDQRKNPVYVYTDEIILAVNVAIATRRPLLVRGDPGSGKSSLARNVADFLGWRYYEKVITSRTRAQDLLWEVDLLRRLHAAQAREGEIDSDYTPYIVPDVLWWAFDPKSARNRGAKNKGQIFQPLNDPCQDVDHPRAVVLLDEIDKADPDVPNNLLVPLGSLLFQVEETGRMVSTIEENAPLVFITTNEEREMPAAFLRRCIEVKLEMPERNRLIEIAKAHFPKIKKADLKKMAYEILGREQNQGSNKSMKISPAEFIDIVRAAIELDVEIGSFTWETLTDITIWKHGRSKETKR